MGEQKRMWEQVLGTAHQGVRCARNTETKAAHPRDGSPWKIKQNTKERSFSQYRDETEGNDF